MSYFLQGINWALPVAPLALILGACIGWIQRDKQRKQKARYAVGDEVCGFSYAAGHECQGKIVKINAYTVYGYVLDTGEELGPYDDISPMEAVKRMEEALEQFQGEYHEHQ